MANIINDMPGNRKRPIKFDTFVSHVCEFVSYFKENRDLSMSKATNRSGEQANEKQTSLDF